MRPLAATAKKASAVMALIRANRWRERVREAPRHRRAARDAREIPVPVPLMRGTVCVLKKEFSNTLSLKSLCGGGVPSSHPSLDQSVFFLSKGAWTGADFTGSENTAWSARKQETK